MGLDLKTVSAASLPRGTRFTALFAGPAVYVGTRPGAAVTLDTADGPVEATAETVAIGPLLTFLNPAMLGLPQHYADPQGRDARAIVDALEAAAPKDKAAIDPRTIYSQIVLTIPATMPALGVIAAA